MNFAEPFDDGSLSVGTKARTEYRPQWKLLDKVIAWFSELMFLYTLLYFKYVTKDANKMKPTRVSPVITAGYFHKNVCCDCGVTHCGHFTVRKIKDS